MKCAFCLEELNPGASVCKVCRREQPLTGAEAEARRQKSGLLYGGSICAIAIIGLAVWIVPDQIARSAAVDRVAECIRLHGDKDITADAVERDIEMGMHETGKSWRAGMQYAALFWTKNGFPDRGQCFITQDSLFSN